MERSRTGEVFWFASNCFTMSRYFAGTSAIFLYVPLHMSGESMRTSFHGHLLAIDLAGQFVDGDVALLHFGSELVWLTSIETEKVLTHFLSLSIIRVFFAVVVSDFGGLSDRRRAISRCPVQSQGWSWALKSDVPSTA